MELEVGKGEVERLAIIVNGIASFEESLSSVTEEDRRKKIKADLKNLQTAKKRFFKRIFS